MLSRSDYLLLLWIDSFQVFTANIDSLTDDGARPGDKPPEDQPGRRLGPIGSGGMHFKMLTAGEIPHAPPGL